MFTTRGHNGANSYVDTAENILLLMNTFSGISATPMNSKQIVQHVFYYLSHILDAINGDCLVLTSCQHSHHGHIGSKHDDGNQ